MSLLFMDGCSHYSTSELDEKWTTLDTTEATWTIAAEGRTDGCIKRVSTAATSEVPGGITKTPLLNQSGIWSQTASGIYGCALKVTDLAALQGGSPGIPSSGLMNNTVLAVTTALGDIIAFGLQTNGTINAYRYRGISQGGHVLLGGTVEALTEDEWAYVEFKWVLDSVSGLVQIRVNGILSMTFSGSTIPTSGDTFPFTPPAPPWTSVRVLATKSAPSPLLTMRMCDCILLDLEGDNDDYLGDVTIAYIKPDGVGDVTNWTPSAGDNWECVDEVPPTGDTDYVEASAAGTIDTYAFEAVAGDPAAIQICQYARKTSEGGTSLRPITRIDTTNYEGVEQGIGSTSYDYYLQPMDTNPDTTAAWTQAEMDAAEWGPDKVT